MKKKKKNKKETNEIIHLSLQFQSVYCISFSSIGWAFQSSLILSVSRYLSVYSVSISLEAPQQRWITILNQFFFFFCISKARFPANFSQLCFSRKFFYLKRKGKSAHRNNNNKKHQPFFLLLFLFDSVYSDTFIFRPKKKKNFEMRREKKKHKKKRIKLLFISSFRTPFVLYIISFRFDFEYREEP